MNIVFYDDAVNPFTQAAALEFVRAHRNIFASRIHRRTLYMDEELIIIKETSYSPNEEEKQVWYWCFTRRKRAIIRDATNREVVEKIPELKKLLI